MGPMVLMFIHSHSFILEIRAEHSAQVKVERGTGDTVVRRMAKAPAIKELMG